LSKNICSGNLGCGGGYPEKALAYVAKSGIALETAYPYKALSGTCKNSSTARNKVVNTATPVSYITQNNATALKTALNTKPIGIYVDATYWSPYASGIFSGCTTRVSYNHAVSIVGYDTVGNWKIRNQWGIYWGEAGYIRLPAAGNPCGLLTYPFATTVI
jgi:cathepsin L